MLDKAKFKSKKAARGMKSMRLTKMVYDFVSVQQDVDQFFPYEHLYISAGLRRFRGLNTLDSRWCAIF